jgi:hypothetical protein
MSSQIGEYPLGEVPDLETIKRSVVRQTLGFEDYLRRGLFVLIASGFVLLYDLSVDPEHDAQFSGSDRNICRA